MYILGVNLAVTAALMLVVWLLSLAKKDVSIVDVVWGLGFVLIAATSFVIADGYLPRKLLVLVLTSVWGLRLAGHIFWRSKGRGEDFRYQAMRKRHGARFALVSLYTVFGLQGVLMWIISLPLQVASMADAPRRLTPFEAAGAALWLVGFLFEAVGDLQLARFKKDHGNSGRVMDRGLWRYTRHPNYFGDVLVWWGFFLIAVPSGMGLGVATVISPVLMTELLMKVSGVALLERTLTKTKPDYRDYARRTSAFFPRLPKS